MPQKSPSAFTIILSAVFTLGSCGAPLADRGHKLKENVLDKDLEQFRYHGHPIHPALVEDLVTPLQDPLPAIVAVELEGGEKHYRGVPWIAVGQNVRWANQEKHGEGFFQYRHVGKTPSGTHVLATAWNGGGSGVFMDLLFVRFEQDDAYEEADHRPRVLLKQIGSFGLGDRDDGTFNLEGDNLYVSASRYRPGKTVLYLP